MTGRRVPLDPERRTIVGGCPCGFWSAFVCDYVQRRARLCGQPSQQHRAVVRRG